ncbi:thiamine ABC transporter ATP-binding protein [Thaumasiovibrio subtropicus]|uniref:thiamine ABC transporter ATP-binding protein n=1 Tax=Thaumasiovibrio subtropicus TaxID=1891207 RepID=UPI000B360F44|nr:thiamine ABC transporter ATP-binding protein [Thaumasiovibrio subtropicus]
MLNVNQLSYTYLHEDKSQSLTFDFALQNGEVLAVLGASGAGKSTLLALLAGFLTPESGEASLNKQTFTDQAPHKRPLSMLFQSHNLFPHLSVKENIGLGIHPGLKLTTMQWQQVDEACENVGLHQLQERLPTTLSGGQQQRVALARALVRQRPLLLLDEPFSALDPALRKEMLIVVKQIAQQQNTTVIMVTHSPEDAHAIADKVAFIDSGHILAFDSAATVIGHPTHESVKRYLGTH